MMVLSTEDSNVCLLKITCGGGGGVSDSIGCYLLQNSNAYNTALPRHTDSSDIF